MCDHQPGDGHSEPFVDVEDPVGIVAADGQQAGAWPLDIEAFLDRQLVAGQRDRLAVEAGGKDDRVAALRAGDGIAERARPFVERVQDGQGTLGRRSRRSWRF